VAEITGIGSFILKASGRGYVSFENRYEVVEVYTEDSRHCVVWKRKHQIGLKPAAGYTPYCSDRPTKAAIYAIRLMARLDKYDTKTKDYQKEFRRVMRFIVTKLKEVNEK